MTKQEEIRERIAREQFIYWCCADEELYPALMEDMRGIADKILSYLHSQGVVIKVDKGLPKLKDVRLYGGGNLDFEHGYESGWNRHKTEVRQAGYEAVAPLVKEGL